MNLSAVMRTAEFDADTPVSLAAVSRQGHMETIAAGRWPDGSAVVETDWFYAASLSKQLTAAAAARLMQATLATPDLERDSYADSACGSVRTRFTSSLLSACT